MIEEVVSDVEIPTEANASGPEDDDDLVIITGELEEHSYSKTKLKLFEQRRTRHAQDPEPDIPLEQLHGWRVISYLMSTNCRSFCGPFLDKPETSMREHWRNYGDCLKDTTWLGKIKQQILDQKTYETLPDIVTDIRMMLEKCYLTFGPHHPVSKKAIKLEQVLEQKINTWPLSLREKCSVDVTRHSSIPRSRLKVEDGESMLIAIIRHEKSVKERELRFRAREDKKFEKEHLAHLAESWELTEVSHKIAEVQGMWEVPHVAHFLLLAQHALGFPDFTMYEFERALLYPRHSQLLHSLMSCLLTTGFKSVSSTANKPPIPYEDWNDKLRVKLQSWYKIYNNHGAKKVFEDAGVEENFFGTLGEQSPYDEVNKEGQYSSFEDFPVSSRVTIIKALCDQRLAKHRTVQEYFVESLYGGEAMRQETIGTDPEGREYFYFPFLSNHDVRIYAMNRFPHKEPHDDCYQVAIKRIPRTPKPKKRKKKQREAEPVVETKSRRKSAKQAAKVMLELSSSESEEEFDEEVVVYNSDGCALMRAGEQQYQIQFSLVAQNVPSLRELIQKLKNEAELLDKQNGCSKNGSDDADDTSNDANDNNEETHGDEEDEDVGRESDNQCPSIVDEESSQDNHSVQPRRSSRAHRQTQRFAEVEETDEDASSSQMPTRRSSRRLQENGEAKVEPLIIKKEPPRERLTMKIVLNKEKTDRRQPPNKRLITELEALLSQFAPYEQGFAQNDQKTRLKLYTEINHPNLLQEEQKQKIEEDKTRRSKRVKDPWSTSSQYMDSEIIYGEAAFDCLSDSDEDSEKSKRPQPTRRSLRGINGNEETVEDDREWKCRDGERF